MSFLARRRRLGRVLNAIVVSTLPLAAECGTDSSSGADGGPDATKSDASDARADGPCNCFDCPIPPTVVQTSFQQCAPSDASADADADVGDAADAGGDGATCYPDCTLPCTDAVGYFNAQQCISGWDNMGACSCPVVSADDAGLVTVDCTIYHICGRRLAGLAEPKRDSHASATGRALAECAWLEAASIRAFRRLAGELEEHGAPRRLVDRARAAARDEARHARAMRRLARKYGGRVPRVVVERVGARSLEAIAIENMAEACVGETYGALVAAWQAKRAGDATVRTALARIAPDELDHATLGWEVAAWIETRLDARANARVRAAAARAIERLVQSARNTPHEDVVRLTGLPTAHEADALLHGLAETVWITTA